MRAVARVIDHAPMRDKHGVLVDVNARVIGAGRRVLPLDVPAPVPIGDCLRGCGMDTATFDPPSSLSFARPRVGSPFTETHHSNTSSSVVSLYFTLFRRAYCLGAVATLGAMGVPSGTVDSSQILRPFSL